jgi:hypothetical protein
LLNKTHMRASTNILSDIRNANDRCVRLADRMERSGATGLAETVVADTLNVALEFGSNPGMHVHQVIAGAKGEPVCQAEDLTRFDATGEGFESRMAAECYSQLKKAMRNESIDVLFSETDMQDLTLIKMASRVIEARRVVPAKRRFRR